MSSAQYPSRERERERERREREREREREKQNAKSTTQRGKHIYVSAECRESGETEVEFSSRPVTIHNALALILNIPGQVDIDVLLSFIRSNTRATLLKSYKKGRRNN